MGRKSLAALARISNLQKVSGGPPQKKQENESVAYTNS